MTTRGKLFLVYPPLLVMCLPGGVPATSTHVNPSLRNVTEVKVAGRKAGEKLPLCGSGGDVMGVPENPSERPYYGIAPRMDEVAREELRIRMELGGQQEWMLLRLCQTRPIPPIPKAAKRSRTHDRAIRMSGSASIQRTETRS